jgi:type IX secretion system PorP/SprF family membrane protein
MKNRYILSIFAASCCGLSALAQDVHFSQYAETPSIINPALAGTTYNTRIAANFKDQWSSVATRYRTVGLSFEQTIKHKKLKNNYFAIAANVFRDEAGDAHLTNLNPNVGISYIQKINKQMKFSGGLQSGFMYRTIDVSNLRWGEQYDGYNYNAALPNGEPNTPRGSITSFDVGGGINLNYVQGDKFLSAKTNARFDAGISAYHYGLGKNSFIVSSEKLDTRMCAYFNSEFAIPNSINSIMPSILYMRQGTSSEVIAGTMFKIILGDPSTYTAIRKPRSVAIGGYYRFKDAIIPSLLFQYNKYVLGLAYDINVSALTPASNRRGGLEIMLRYNMVPGYGVNLGRKDTKASY